MNNQIKYFFKMGEAERDLVRKWRELVSGKTTLQNNFLKVVDEALVEVKSDYWISTIEPTFKDSKIHFEVNCSVAKGIHSKLWKKKAKAYAPENGSRLGTLEELALWYAYRIAKGFWSLEYVCDDSSSSGNYWDSPNSTHDFEKTGVRETGGFSDGIGNTFKLVTCKEGFALFGGYCGGFGGHASPVANIRRVYGDLIHLTASAVIVLTK